MSRQRKIPVERRTYKITVPVSDGRVIAWLENQDSPSLSIRELIKRCVDRRGYADYFDSEPDAQGKRVRRTQAEIAEDEADEAVRRAAESRVRDDAPTSAAWHNKPVASNARSQSMLNSAMDMFVDGGSEDGDKGSARTQAEMMKDLMGRK